jgi:hypothetical protein
VQVPIGLVILERRAKSNRRQGHPLGFDWHLTNPKRQRGFPFVAASADARALTNPKRQRGCPLFNTYHRYRSSPEPTWNARKSVSQRCDPGPY